MAKRIEAAVNEKFGQWEMEAMLFNAAHGRRGGEFAIRKWANGRVMAGPVGCRCNQEIPVEDFDALRAAGWKIRVPDLREVAGFMF